LFCKTTPIQKSESYSTISDNDNILLTDLFPDENSSCLSNFINSVLFSSNRENSVKFWNELSRGSAALFWLKDITENGKYNETKNLISQKHDSIISPKKSFIIPAIFLANSESEFGKKEILKNLPNKYSYEIPNIISAFSARKKAFSFFL
jgi:hypothetical protein